MFTLNSEHDFCKNIWKMYLKEENEETLVDTQIKMENESFTSQYNVFITGRIVSISLKLDMIMEKNFAI